MGVGVGRDWYLHGTQVVGHVAVVVVVIALGLVGRRGTLTCV